MKKGAARHMYTVLEPDRKEKYNKSFAGLCIVVAVISLCVILFFSFIAIKEMSASYHEMLSADITKDYTGSINYNDHFYAMLGRGVIIDSTVDGDRYGLRESFVGETLQAIDQRICSAGIIYAMMISSLCLYPILSLSKRKSSVFSVCAVITGIYIVFLLAILLIHKSFDVPFYFPNEYDILKLIAGLVSVIGGHCVASLLISRIRLKKTVAIILVPSLVVIFSISALMEVFLYSPATIDSFNYIAEIDGRYADENFEGECYYDSEKNVMVLEGKEYPPEQLENPEHFTGIKRCGALLFEIVNPYSGNSLYLVEEEIENKIGAPIYLVYLFKGIVWAIIAIRNSK